MKTKIEKGDSREGSLCGDCGQPFRAGEEVKMGAAPLRSRVQGGTVATPARIAKLVHKTCAKR